MQNSRKDLVIAPNQKEQMSSAIEIHLFPPTCVNKELLLPDESSEIMLSVLLLTQATSMTNKHNKPLPALFI